MNTTFNTSKALASAEIKALVTDLTTDKISQSDFGNKLFATEFADKTNPAGFFTNLPTVINALKQGFGFVLSSDAISAVLAKLEAPKNQIEFYEMSLAVAPLLKKTPTETRVKIKNHFALPSEIATVPEKISSYLNTTSSLEGVCYNYFIQNHMNFDLFKAKKVSFDYIKENEKRDQSSKQQIRYSTQPWANYMVLLPVFKEKATAGIYPELMTTAEANEALAILQAEIDSLKQQLAEATKPAKPVTGKPSARTKTTAGSK